MASMWWAQDNDTTVKTNSELEDLFVFGYACKLFRDDDRANNIDKGKHLIPWMGDDQLLIDRYDGRGHLYDLSAYDADTVKGQECELSETEKAVEAACDEERYLELRTDVAEAELYQEEEWKRYYESLHDGYKAVGFSYTQGQDDPSLSQDEQSIADAEEDKPYVPLAELQLPKGINMPPTKKVYTIMEKTAKFIAEHGTQMEIIIKAKQSGNGQFDFMHFEDRLYQFYKHLIKMIKSGKFKPKPTEVESQDSHEDEDNQHGYLHPLLNANCAPLPIKKPVPIPAVAIHTTCYGQLIKSIKKQSLQAEISSTSRQDDRNTPPLAPPPIPPFVTQPAFDPAHPGLPPPPGTEPVVLPNPELPHLLGLEMEMNGTCKPEVERGSSSVAPSSIVPPPPDIQPIIDRMAMYVAKNGVEFEIVVKSKTDTRFQFLHSHHVHFPYYDFKKQLFLKEVEQERLEKEEEAAAAANKSVSFSIKTRPKEPETSVTQLKKPLFDYGSSDDENEGESDGRLERTSDAVMSSSPTVSDSGQISEVIPEVKPLVRSDIPVDLLEKKMAEERLKDRLANAAREKLAQANKEKQVQAERKRKAAMFINLLKTKPTSVDENSRDSTTDTSCPLGNSAQSSMANVDPGHNRLLPRSEYDRHDGYRRGWPRSRSRSPRVGYRSRSRSPRPRYRSRSKSPLYVWRRRRSPTPPSAFSVTRRSRSRSPGRRVSPSRMGNGRRRSRSRSPRRAAPLVRTSGRRSRSPKKPNRSPTRKRSRSRDRKRKSPSKSKKRSRSRTPSSKHKKSKKLDSRSPKKKKKDKDREKSKDKRKDKSKDRSKDKEKHKSKSRTDKVVSADINTNKCEVKATDNGKRSESEDDAKSRDSSSDSGDEDSPRRSPSSRTIDPDPVEVIEIDDIDDPTTDPDVPIHAPPPPPQPEGERTQSPRIFLDGDLPDPSSGRGSPSVDPTKPPREVPQHLLSRVRALLKASRDEALKPKEDGLENS